MKVVALAATPAEVVGGALFPSGEVSRQSILSAADSKQLSFTLLTFASGAENAWHTHTGDQVVLVVSGTARVGNAQEERIVGPHELVLFPAGEPHFHAGAGSEPASFFSITQTGTTTNVVEHA